jgi:hypothetical protein
MTWERTKAWECTKACERSGSLKRNIRQYLGKGSLAHGSCVTFAAVDMPARTNVPVFQKTAPDYEKGPRRPRHSMFARRRAWRLIPGIIGRWRECAAPASRAQAGVLLERSVEMALAREAAECGDFRQCEVRSFEELLRLAHAPGNQPSMRRHAGRMPKCARKMSDGQTTSGLDRDGAAVIPALVINDVLVKHRHEERVIISQRGALLDRFVELQFGDGEKPAAQGSLNMCRRLGHPEAIGKLPRHMREIAAISMLQTGCSSRPTPHI